MSHSFPHSPTSHPLQERRDQQLKLSASFRRTGTMAETAQDAVVATFEGPTGDLRVEVNQEKQPENTWFERMITSSGNTTWRETKNLTK